MLKQILNGLILSLLVWSTSVLAGTGDLFRVSPSGRVLSQTVSFTLCLNINDPKPISCQNYTTQKSTLTINTTTPNKTYSFAGIKINTPSYIYTKHRLINNAEVRGTKLAAQGFSFLGQVSDTHSVIATISSSQENFTVTASGDTHVTPSPTSQSVAYNANGTVNLTVAAGYTASIASDTCGGSLTGTTYTTGAVTSNCSVSFSSTLQNFTVSASGNANVTPDPTSQSVAYNARGTVNLTVASGYTASIATDTCGGSLTTPTTYRTGDVTSNCSVSFSGFATPTITSVFPSSGSINGGTSVTITGTNLTDASSVSFGNIPGTINAVISATSIRATSPAATQGVIDVTVTTTDGATSSPSDGDKFTFGDAFTYIADLGDGGNYGNIYYCIINSTDGALSCSITPLPTPFGSPYAIAFATALNSEQYAYVTDTGTTDFSTRGVYQCNVSLSGQLSNCTPMNLGSMPESASPGAIKIITVNNKQFAYVIDSNSGSTGHTTLYFCSIKRDGSFGNPNCESTPSSPPWLTGTDRIQDINFAAVNGVVHAYVADNHGGFDTSGLIYICDINSDGSLSNCVPAAESGVSDGPFPNVINFASSNGTQYAYIGQSQSGEGVYQCSFNPN